jgi:hypothetical protein
MISSPPQALKFKNTTMKNEPITARISKGLFGKTKEPLLNVGAAGVNGKNTTRDIPSPATKRGYAMSSPLKSDPVKKQSVAEEGGKQVQTTTFEEKGAGAAIVKAAKAKKKANSTSNYDAAQVGLIDLGKDFKPTAAQTARANKRNAEAKAKDKVANDAADATNSLAETPVDVKDTEKKTYKKTLTTRDKGDTQYALERRNNIRAGKVSNRTEKRGAINEAKAQAKVDGLKGKEKRDYIKNAKNQAKLKQAKSNRKISADQSRGAEMQSKQNKSVDTGGTVYGDERNKTASETPDSLGTLVTGAPKKTPSFFSKKSPMKMKYFK